MKKRVAGSGSLGIICAWLAAGVLAGGCGDSGGTQAPPDPLVAGPYPVGVTRVTFYDAARDRTLLTEVWYPAAESARGLPPSPLSDYLPPALGSLLADATVPVVAVRDVPIARGGPFPLIAFSHGSGGIRFQNTFQVEHLASHGFVVAAPDHQGNTLLEPPGDLSRLAIERPLDIRFVLDQLSGLTADQSSPFFGWIDTKRPFGVTGHSFGSLTSLAVASQDARIAAALPMAFSGPVSQSYDAATLLMLATEDQTIGLAQNQAIRDTYAALPGPRYFAEVVDAGHYSFTISCDTGRGLGDGDGCGSGRRLEDRSTFEFTDHRRIWDLVDGYSAALFGRYLRDIEEYDKTLETNLDPAIVRYTFDTRKRAAASAASALFFAPSMQDTIATGEAKLRAGLPVGR